MGYQKFGRNIEDASLGDAAVALPAAESSSVYADDIDLGADDFKPDGFEIEVNLPALDSTELPNTKTLTVAICAGDSANPTTVIADAILVSTGADDAGAAAQSVRYRVPPDVGRYVRPRFTTGAGTGNCSSSEASVKVKF